MALVPHLPFIQQVAEDMEFLCINVIDKKELFFKLKNIKNTKSSTNLNMKYKTQYPSPTKPKIAHKIKNNISKKRTQMDS